MAAIDIVASRSGLTYDLHDLQGSPAFDNANTALRGNIHLSVQGCEGFQPLMRLFNFQIRDEGGPYALQISEAHRPLCQCQDSGVACKHIFWLMDQLMQAGQDHFGPVPEPIRPLINGSVVHVDLAQLIRNIGLPSLGTNRGWNVRTRASTGDGDEGPEGQREELGNRIDVLNSIITPDRNMQTQFRQFERNSDSNIFGTVIQEFQELIQDHAVNDPGFGQRLDQILTQSFTATAKLVRKKFDYLETLNRFDATRSPFTRGPMSVEACAEALRRHVRDIASVITDPVNRRPNVTWAGIGLLLDILCEVLDRNYNMHDPKDQSANPLQNNLCVQLITSTATPRFIVEDLNDMTSLFSHPFRSHRQRINLLTQIIKRSGLSKGYLDNFENLLRHIPERPL